MFLLEENLIGWIAANLIKIKNYYILKCPLLTNCYWLLRIFGFLLDLIMLNYCRQQCVASSPFCFLNMTKDFPDSWVLQFGRPQRILAERFAFRRQLSEGTTDVRFLAAFFASSTFSDSLVSSVTSILRTEWPPKQNFLIG